VRLAFVRAGCDAYSPPCRTLVHHARTMLGQARSGYAMESGTYRVDCLSCTVLSNTSRPEFLPRAGARFSRASERNVYLAERLSASSWA